MEEELELKVKRDPERFDMILSTKSEKFIDKNLLNQVVAFALFSHPEFFTLWQLLIDHFFKQVDSAKLEQE